MSGDGQLEQNLRQAFSDGKGQDLDAKYPSIQEGEEKQGNAGGASRLGPQVR